MLQNRNDLEKKEGSYKLLKAFKIDKIFSKKVSVSLAIFSTGSTF